MNIHDLVGRNVMICVDQIGLKANIRGMLHQFEDTTFGVEGLNMNIRFYAGKVSNIFDDGEKSPRIELF